jgi:hypothetical protein
MREEEQTQHPVREIPPFFHAMRKERHLHEKKAALGNQLSSVADQLIIAGLIGIRQLPAERLHLSEKERFAQEEYRLQQDIIRCQGLYTQIEVINFEFSLLYRLT